MLVVVRAVPSGALVALEGSGLDLMCREPEAPTQTLAFDGETNGALLAALVADPRRYLLQGGTLYRDGQAQAIAPPSQAYTDYQAALELARSLKAYNALGSPSNAQSIAAIKANNRLTLVLARLLLRELAAE